MADRPTPARLRALRAQDPKTRARDLAAMHGFPEATLVAAHVGHGVTVIDPTPDRLIPAVQGLGDVLALTRNASCVHERKGTYQGYHAGPQAQMVLGAEIDLRIFPTHWVHGFAVEEATAEGVKRSVQVFDAAGDAVHKVHLTSASDVAGFAALVKALRLPDQRDILNPAPTAQVDAARGDPSRVADLREEWDRMTDTHQFLHLVRKLKMNRLGAYRMVGAPQARALAPRSVTEALTRSAEGRVPLMIFGHLE